MAIDTARIILAAEYFLGTLPNKDQLEAEELLRRDEEFRDEVRFWERRFAPLGLSLQPISPPPTVWLGITRRIESAPPARLKRTRTQPVTVWAWLATAASVVLSVAILFQVNRPIPEPQVITKQIEVPVAAPTYVALLQLPESKMQWSVSAVSDRRQLLVRATGELAPVLNGKDPELWLIANGTPVSLGVMPKSGEVSRQIPAGLPFVPGQVLAVSIEPPGGSPTGQPTGPVVATTAIFQAV